MIIGIDGNEANVSRLVGIGEYAFQLLKHFHSANLQDVEFRIYLKGKPLPHMPPKSKKWKYVIVGPRKLWTQIGLPIYLFTHLPRPNVFFTPSHYAPRISPVPTAVSVMDLSYVHFPELFAKKDLYQLREWTKYSVRNAKKIFTISESSKNDIINYYRIPSDRVVVTHLGMKDRQDTPVSFDELQKKFALPKKYILFVGTIQPRKNIGRLIDGFAAVAKKHKDVDLVIVGKKGWMYEPILAEPAKMGIENRVHFLDFVNDAELAGLYTNAICYCLPSLYEGFGLPILEAMQYECPVIASNVSSLPEAGGDACLYVDPERPTDIAQKIVELIEKPALRKKLKEKGLEHIKKFSWTKAAAQTLVVLEELGGKKV
ncbi:MAG: glycosyltransferase family 4 protein [Patescibacteria group bacterium]|nr:glycosyltransferase family 4 protein [Patescibacteria group bacterium]